MTTTVKASPKRRPPRKSGNPKLDRATQAVSDKLVQNIVDEAERAIVVSDARVAAAEADYAKANGHKPTPVRDMANVRVYGPNGIEGGGHFHIHKAGCSDLRKVEYKRLASEAWGTSALTQYEIVLGIYEDIIREGDYGGEVNGVHELGSSTVTFFPCLDGLLVTLADDERQPGKAEPNKAEPKPIRRTRAPKPEPTAPQPASDTSATGTPVEREAYPTEDRHAVVVETQKPTSVKRTAKQVLARLVIQAVSDRLCNDPDLDGVLPGMTRDEVFRTVSQWTHHLPTGQDAEGRRWWPLDLPRPDRSDWR